MASKCGAKTRAGGRCQQPGMPKNGRCRYHGGLSTGPGLGNQNATKTGIYARHMSEDEQKDYHSLTLGNVDHELRVARVQLARALAAQAAANGDTELEEVVKHDLIGTEGSKKDEKRRVRDYPSIINMLLGRIESLEKTRAELIKRGEENPDDPDKSPIGRIVVEVRHAKPSHDDDRPAS